MGALAPVDARLIKLSLWRSRSSASAWPLRTITRRSAVTVPITAHVIAWAVKAACTDPTNWGRTHKMNP
jgi:hypothetical protein